MTPITYEETAKLLGVSVSSLRSAANRGLLTRLPRTGQKQPLIREQVMLFQGKPRLSLHVLTTQEKKEWAQYAQGKESENIQQAPEAGNLNSDVLVGAALAGAALAGALPALAEVPQGNPFQALALLLKRTRSQAV